MVKVNQGDYLNILVLLKYTGVIPKSLLVLSTEPDLRKSAVDREIQFSTEKYGCRQRNDCKCVILLYGSLFLDSNRF